MTLRTITLYGPMRMRFGRTFRFHLETNTVAEAFQALCSQVRGFQRYLADAKSNGIGFTIFVGKKNLATEDLRDRFVEGDIRIAPIILGSKNGGVFNIILGAVLVVVGVLGETYGQAFGGGVWGPYLINAGVAMIAGGVIQLLTPVPKGQKNQDGANAPSYVFNGAVNTTAQNNPVPVLYGRMIVGSAVISGGIDAEDYAPSSATTSPVGTGTPTGSSKSTPYE